MAGAILARLVEQTGSAHSRHGAQDLLSRAAKEQLCEHSRRTQVLPQRHRQHYLPCGTGSLLRPSTQWQNKVPTLA